MKFIKLSFILLAFYINGNAQNRPTRDLFGRYEYLSKMSIGSDGCCKLIWNLELRTDSTFYTAIVNDQGDYIKFYESYGIIDIRKDTISLYSNIVKDMGILEKLNQNIPDSIFIISFNNDGWNMGYLYEVLNNRKFYSLGENFKRVQIDPIITIPDKKKVDSTGGYSNIDIGIDPRNIKNVSYIFLRSDIEKYLYSEREYNDGSVSDELLIKMQDYVHHGYLIRPNKNPDGNDQTNKRFFDVSTRRFIIKKNKIISIDKNGKKGGVVFKRIKMEDK